MDVKEHFDIFEYLAAIPVFKERGKIYKTKCICGGTLTSIRSKYNGHLSVKCDRCKFTLIE